MLLVKHTLPNLIAIRIPWGRLIDAFYEFVKITLSNGIGLMTVERSKSRHLCFVWERITECNEGKDDLFI